MKKLTIICLTILTTLFAEAQGSMTPSWIKLDSSVNGQSEGWGVDVDSNGHIFWAVNNNSLNQGLDIYCYKYAFGGSSLWTNPFFFGGIGTQQSYVVNANDTALYIGGRTCTGLVTTCDMLLMKIDKSLGNLTWDKTLNFSASGYDEVDGLEIRPDGIYCGGWCQELDGAIYRSDIGLWKLDYNGNTQWTNYIGANNTAEHQDGHFVVDANNIYAAGLWGGTGIANLYNGYSFVGKFDNLNGNLIDSTLFGPQSGNINDIENALGMTSDGTYLYITGYTTPVSSNDWQIFVAKFDKNLDQLWYIDWGGSDTETARGIAVKNDKIYVAGLSQSNSIISGTEQDAVLLTLDTSGNVLSYHTYDSGEKESFRDIAMHNEHIYLSGTIENSALVKKSMLIALEGSVNSIPEQETFKNNFNVYPNPSNGSTKIIFDQQNHGNALLMVFDISGKLILKEAVKASDQSIDLELENSGVFYFQMIFSDYRLTKKVLNFN